MKIEPHVPIPVMTSRLLFLTCMPLSEPKSASVLVFEYAFDSDLAQGARLSFPLKLSSLLGAGCPLLAFGPEGSSVVRLVRQYACGAVCTEPNALALAAALEGLTNDGVARQTALQGIEKLRADLSRDKFLAAFETFITV